MRFPTPFTVGVHSYSESGEDDYGRDEPMWTPPKDEPGTPQAVHGWSSPSSTEPKLAGHDRVEVHIELLVPPEFSTGPHDVIDLEGVQYEVIGYPEDFTGSPFGGVGGKVVNLRRVEG
ncbi:hypothetical protein AVANI_10 [Mycobacterium phage Avani]|uniref:Head-to-tail stopper n=6 Tax=Avanivirus TaxID=2843352 RepID=A0A2D1G9N7_9CAUD|nr:head-tail adaptor [Mycobacterium phage Che9d]YP_008410682.1 head-tail adaptor [Mycobacterium phage Jabbawokkie]YP_009013105.1 head-tail adaptor [Mycobacterium phage Avani]YP_009613914.1 head-tail adaptor [Mycobacterium phage Yoshi]YP_009963708.1 head-tail adaptor [Mycobacterium phage Demsculpinboyz]YP_009963825.1 head-tail adaptor [Mycobacterium phage Soul22]YP_009963928.1 head-tail adaptor [Mycobacterium phage Zapner]QXG07380.1 head to tail connector protein [Mycobacterium phage RitSun]